jgi:hypothetical protein
VIKGEKMSKVSAKINNIKDKLDSISGLDGDFTFERILEIEKVVNEKVNEIDKHCNEDETNGTIFE